MHLPHLSPLKISRPKLTVADFFAGIGGIGLGFKQAGFKIVYANEIDKFCCQTYRANFGDIDDRDVKEVSASEIPDFDVLLAGFPCQPFSRAGHRKGLDDPRGNLFFELEKIIEAKRPRAFLLENVRFLQKHDGGKTLEKIMYVLENRLGYFVPPPKVLNSRNFGVPQNRERIYIVGFRESTEFIFPEGNVKTSRVKDVLERNVDEKYFLSQLYMDCLVRHKKHHEKLGHGFGFRIIDPDGVANALTVGRMGRERNLIEESRRPINRNNFGLRMLTVRECARVQGFPDSFVFPVSNNQAYKQLGNAVSVPVVKEIAIAMHRALNDKERPEDVGVVEVTSNLKLNRF